MADVGGSTSAHIKNDELINCVRPGDWRNIYPDTVDKLYNWGLFYVGGGYTGAGVYLGYPKVSPMFVDRVLGYAESEDIAFRYDEDKAIETDIMIRKACDMHDLMGFVFYYARRLSYVEAAKSMSSLNEKDGLPAIDDKQFKITVGHAVAKLDTGFRLR